MARINERAAMRLRQEEKTLKHIATYINKRDMSLEDCFRRFEIDTDGYMDIDELKEMLVAMDVPVNQQLLRMLISIFDKNEDHRISIDEFEGALEKYMVKKKIVAAEIESKIIGKKDAEELAEMYNEEVRPKAVFEDFSFDPENKRTREKREAEALALIKEGKMPVDMISGDLTILLDSFKSLVEIPGLTEAWVVTKLTHYSSPEAEIVKEKAAGRLIKKFSREEGTMRMRIPLILLNGRDRNLQADTIHTEVWLGPPGT
jgi:hypothetical protein